MYYFAKNHLLIRENSHLIQGNNEEKEKNNNAQSILLFGNFEILNFGRKKKNINYTFLFFYSL